MSKPPFNRKATVHRRDVDPTASEFISCGFLAHSRPGGRHYDPITILTYAAIGAATGAVVAAVTGGNILKGALFGAIGGAIGGAFTTMLGAAGSCLLYTSPSPRDS